MRYNHANHLFLEHDGYGRLGRNLVRAALRAGHDVYPFVLSALDMPAWYQRAQGISFDVATLQLCPPHNMRHIPGRSIGYSMHESMTLPRGWADHVNHKCQGLIVPSPWLIPVFQDAGVKIPVAVVPGGIDPDECPIVTKSLRRDEPYAFLCLADRGGRKGHDEVHTAFYKAFDYRNKDVRLIMKCRPSSLPGLDFSYSSDSRFTIWRADVERMSDVFAHADACINPNRCEGYGMWPREAAACGLPTVVTNWSGTADDCEQWAYPLNDFKLRESHMEDCGGLWAVPNIDEIVERMRWLYEHQDEARQKGLQAARWMRANHTYDHAVHKLVSAMSGFLGGPPPEPLPDVPAWGEPIPADLRRTLRERNNGHKEVALEQ